MDLPIIKSMGDINTPYLLDTTLLCSNEEVHLRKFSASPMSSGDRKNKDETDNTPNSKVNPISHDTSKHNGNPGMEDKSKCKTTPQLITSAVKSNTQGGNLTKPGANISTSGPHGRRCS